MEQHALAIRAGANPPCRDPDHPGGNPGANLESISHRCHPILVACVWELTKKPIKLPLGCLQGASPGSGDPWRGAARAEDTHGTPTQSHITPSILVYEDIMGIDQRNSPPHLFSPHQLCRGKEPI